MSDPAPASVRAQEAALDNIGTYLAHCCDADDLGEPVVGTCPQHPVTVGDLWALYCEGRPADAASIAGAWKVLDA